MPLTNTAPSTNVRVLMTITNLGPSPATGVTLRDALPAGATYLSDNQGACTNAAGVATCIVGSLAVNASFSVLVTVQVAASAAGTTLVNTATKSANQPDPVASNDSSTDRLSVGTAADLELHKTVSPTNASVGQEVTYSLAVTNNGPSPTTSLSVGDPLPSGLEFVSAQAGCSYAAGTRQLTCTSGPLAVGVTRTLTFVARPTNAAAGTTVQNRATASSTVQDAEPANNVDFAALPVAPRADLRIVKRPADTTLRVDQDVTYTLTATNDGPNDATGVVVTDSVPTGMRFVSASPGCIYDAGPPETVTCAVGDLADGASTEVTVTLRPRRALAGETVPNAGTVRGDQPDPNLADNSGVTSVIVLAQADLQLSKSAASPTAVAGGTLTYTLSVFNEGPSTAPTTTVEDRLPLGRRGALGRAQPGHVHDRHRARHVRARRARVRRHRAGARRGGGSRRCGRKHTRKLRHGRRRGPRSPPAGQRSVRLDTGRQRVDLAPPAAAATRAAAAAAAGPCRRDRSSGRRRRRADVPVAAAMDHIHEGALWWTRHLLPDGAQPGRPRGVGSARLQPPAPRARDRVRSPRAHPRPRRLLDDRPVRRPRQPHAGRTGSSRQLAPRHYHRPSNRRPSRQLASRHQHRQRDSDQRRDRPRRREHRH